MLIRKKNYLEESLLLFLLSYTNVNFSSFLFPVLHKVCDGWTQFRKLFLYLKFVEQRGKTTNLKLEASFTTELSFHVITIYKSSNVREF